MGTLERIVIEALTWQQTPWHHMAGLKGIGCDCVGLLYGVGKALGLVARDWRPPVYSKEWHLHRHEELLRTTMESLGCLEVPLDARQPGHILLFQYGHVASHAGILVSRNPERLIHARLNERVACHGLSGHLLERLRAAYAFPERHYT